MKIGFLLSQYGDNELAKAFIKSSNFLMCNRNDVDIIGFVINQCQPTSNPLFATMNINEAFDYDGAVIASDIETAEKLSRFPGPRQRYYYLWELDWMGSNRTFEEWLSVFHNPRLSIVARTSEDRRIIERCWNCRVASVIPDCDMEEFTKLISKKC